MRNFFVIICACFFVSITYAQKDIVLKKLTHSNLKICENSAQLQIKSDVDQFERFSIPDENYLTISLLSENGKACYSFPYYPELSVYPLLSIKNNRFTIIEMVGSTLGGNGLRKEYKIDFKHGKLIQNKCKYSSFSIDEKSETHEAVSDCSDE